MLTCTKECHCTCLKISTLVSHWPQRRLLPGNNMVLFFILFLNLLYMSNAQEIPGVEELPLTEADIQIAQTASTPAISIKGSKNQTCLLTQRYVPEASNGCTWRTIRKCMTKSENKKIPVYDARCMVDEKGVHSTNCQVTIV
jgi:hypothetical protein